MTDRETLLRELTDGGVPEHEHKLGFASQDLIEPLVRYAIAYRGEAWLAAKMRELCAACDSERSRATSDLWEKLGHRGVCREAADCSLDVFLTLDDGRRIRMAAPEALRRVRCGHLTPSEAEPAPFHRHRRRRPLPESAAPTVVSPDREEASHG